MEPKQLFEFLNKELPDKLLIGHNLKFDLEEIMNIFESLISKGLIEIENKKINVVRK